MHTLIKMRTHACARRSHTERHRMCGTASVGGAVGMAAARAVAGVTQAPHVVAIRSHLIAPSQVSVANGIVYDIVVNNGGIVKEFGQ